MASLSFLAKWEPAGLYLLSGKYPASPFAAPLLAFLFICFSHSRSLTPVFLHSWQPSLAFLILFLSTYLVFFWFFLTNLRTGKTFFFTANGAQERGQRVIVLLKQHGADRLRWWQHGIRTPEAVLSFVFPQASFSFQQTHTHECGSLPRQLIMNFLPHFLSKKTVHGDVSQLFIHTELDGISQHFKKLAEISKKAWSVAEGACDDNQQHIMIFSRILWRWTVQQYIQYLQWLYSIIRVSAVSLGFLTKSKWLTGG